MTVGATQKRALFYVFDGGTGVGHLRRLACIAKHMQGRFACLLVTGHRAAASWFVPEECEYIHLPSWDNLFEAKASYWGRKPFVTLPRGDAVRLREEMLTGVVRAFQPDVLFVDHLPLGAEEELTRTLEQTRCRKYLISRGVLNETEDLRKLILGGKAREYLENYYDRIFAAADPKVFDFTKQYNLSPRIRDKTLHTGYVTERIPSECIARTRAGRGLRGDDLWVVASAGGGQLGEQLIERCLSLAREHPKVAFDVVMGPRSSLPWEDLQRTVIDPERVRFHREARDMPSLNVSADLVISSGGYNTLLEAVQGKAHILCFPLRKSHRDEQYQHALRLQRFVNIDVSTDLRELPALFARAIDGLSQGRRGDRRAELDLAGAEAIERAVMLDLRGAKPSEAGYQAASPVAARRES